MSNTIQDVLTAMSGKSVTLKWDVLVIHDADAVNKLFAQQYVANVAQGQVLPPITTTLSPSSGVTVQCNAVTLGMPLISFAPGLDPQDAIVIMPFVSGEIVVTTTSGQAEYVSGYQSITPMSGYALRMVVPLQQVTGQVIPPNQGQPVTANKVVVNLAGANTYTANLVGGSSAASYLGQYFGSVFKKETGGALQYELGSLVFGSGENLLPVMFDMRTLPGGTSSSDGAVLLLVATNYNPKGGNFPGAEFPNLLPSGYDCTVIVASHTLLNNLVSPYLQAHMVGGPTMGVSGTGSKVSVLTMNGGGYPMSAVTVSSPSEFTWGSISTGDFSVPYNGISLQAENDLLTINWNGSFEQPYSGTQFRSNGEGKTFGTLIHGNMDIKVSANYTSRLGVTSGGNVTFTTQNGGYAHATASASSNWLTPAMVRDLPGPVQGAVANAVGGLGTLPLPSVKTFAVDHLLFPAQNALVLSEAHLPGDVALFGKIEPTETAFTVAPLQVVLSQGETQQFSLSDSAATIWTVNGSSSSAGVITPNGFYTAPSPVTATTPVVVTAQQGANKTTAVVLVVPAPVVVSPAYLLLSPGAGKQAFFAGCAGSTTGAPSWSIVPDDGTVGTIDAASGVYTPPSSFPTGIATATITAIFQAGSASALVCLVNATFAFAVSPLISPVLSPGQTQQFMVESGVNVTWMVFPEGAGSISGQGLYTAPDNIAQPSTAIVVAQDIISGIDLMGVGLVLLAPPES